MKNPYLLQMVRNHNRDRFLQSLFVPEPARDAVLAVYSLDAELAHVRAHVSEEMLAHIRYAWWEESLADIAAGKKPREHPVLLAIAENNLGAAGLALAQKYRAAYPDAPMENIADESVALLIPTNVQMLWDKAGRIITKHRTRHGKKWNGWLAFKLLCIGIVRKTG
jgi:15-cis-phytoene synthase